MFLSLADDRLFSSNPPYLIETNFYQSRASFKSLFLSIKQSLFDQFQLDKIFVNFFMF